MNNDAQRIRAALDRRFARAVAPECPAAAWQPTGPAPATIGRRTGLPRRGTYAAALLVAVAVGGLAAQAQPAINRAIAKFGFVSSKPIQPMIHQADRLTIAEAQRSIAFTIVEPKGLPAGTQFLYAHTINDRVVLTYQAHLGGKYYRIAITESTRPAGPPIAHAAVKFEYLRTADGRIEPGGVTEWTLPLRRWKHGDVTMDMLDPGFPGGVTDRIVRANTQ